jgi:bifunctional non-homologous end joining protein LigD
MLVNVAFRAGVSHMTAKSSKGAAPEISNPQKVFWPEQGYTKLDLALYYRQVFPLLRPYVLDRFLTLERCPDGMAGQCFYQKEKPSSMPPGTPTKRLQNATGTRTSTNYVLGGSLETQLALVNLGCIAIHVMGSRAKTFPNPDWVCFDLDPASGKFADAAKAARQIKEMLDHLDLISFPKTSGSRGLHIFIPIRVGLPARDVLNFAEALVKRAAELHPKELSVDRAIKDRGNRVYLDPFRNGSVQTVVTPYSVRRRAGAPVSTPLAWTEVKESIEPAQFNMKNFGQRMAKRDPWIDFLQSRQSLAPAISKLKKL